MAIQQKWIAAYWRWFLIAIDKKDYQQAILLASIIERL